MIRIRVTGDTLDPIVRLLDRATFPDLTPLAHEIGGLLVEGNRAGLLAGTDGFGDPMAPVKESTVRRGRGGDGSPIVPRGAASRAAADARYRVEPGPDRLLVIMDWPNTPYIHFHVTGFTVHSATGPVAVVPRDPTGIRPETAGLIADATGRFAASLIGGD